MLVIRIYFYTARQISSSKFPISSISPTILPFDYEQKALTGTGTYRERYHVQYLLVFSKLQETRLYISASRKITYSKYSNIVHFHILNKQAHST